MTELKTYGYQSDRDKVTKPLPMSRGQAYEVHMVLGRRLQGLTAAMRSQDRRIKLARTRGDPKLSAIVMYQAELTKDYSVLRAFYDVLGETYELGGY